MKTFKSTLAVVALLAFSPLSARVSKQAPAKKATPTQRQSTTPVTQPVSGDEAGKTYPELVNLVKNSNKANVWDSSKSLLAASFIDSMIYEALAADIDALQFDALLQLARDYHMTLWSTQKDNIDMLNNLRAQRQNAIEILSAKQTASALSGAL